jgi:hypothetical protein
MLSFGANFEDFSVEMQTGIRTISDTRNEATDDQLGSSVCGGLNDSSHNHDPVPIHDCFPSTELIAPDGGRHAAKKAADVIERNLQNCQTLSIPRIMTSPPAIRPELE